MKRIWMCLLALLLLAGAAEKRRRRRRASGGRSWPRLLQPGADHGVG